MLRLREHLDDLTALIGAAAEQLSLDQTFLEKDFWAMEVLRSVAAPYEVAGPAGTGELRVIFKGGTSLSRAYGLIERFSEDVDVLLVFPDIGMGAGSRDRALKAKRDAAAQHLGLESNQIVPKESTTGIKRNVRYLYPTLVAPSPAAVQAISEGVLLEMGSRGGTFPTRQHRIRSLIADFAIDVLGDTPDTWEEFAPFEVEVLAPERTLFEKLAALHDAASRAPDEAALSALRRNARHLYDIHCLLADDHVVTALEELGPTGIAALCVDVDEHSEKAEFSYTPRPAEGFGDSPLVAHRHPGAEALEDGYRQAMELVYGTKPTLVDCLGTIRAHRRLL
ncbi:nucleotidyl transferase AbiEii/AbiGii toxin family protein [Prescottella sp. R16]|uniref:nucleotidyl transferase AbiEii/AbiGii toxin family protein n=1 Tax=Prescottella sp. R16 TaxID=3064529 RepID=UPI00272E93F0|nr:nucleotidyl transferase AbiEii/AbiGii toxin family protein [Prescottella sp. R16]